MNFSSLRSRIENWIQNPVFVFAILFLITVITYGLLIPWQHMYIDDWIWTWAWQKMGPAGIREYFETYRPAWGWLFQITMPVLYGKITAYHIFSLFIRWLSTITFWWLFRLIWPNKTLAAVIAAILFLIYPGFSLQPIALTYSHIFLVYIFFLLSLCFNLIALKSKKWYWLLIGIALFFSILNLIMLEFFFTLELFRIIVISIAVFRPDARLITNIKRIFTIWLPFLAIWIGAVIWRSFFFKFQASRYQLNVITELLDKPVITIANLIKTIITDLINTSLGSWLPAVKRLFGLSLENPSSYITLILTFSVAAAIFIFFKLFESIEKKQDKSQGHSLLMAGVLAILAAGWPFWLTKLSVQVTFFESRFTIPFILGVALFLTGLFEFIRPRWLGIGILSLAIGLATGYHFLIANDFRNEWEWNQRFLWQLSLRAPDIEEGTTLLVSDMPTNYYNEATLATEIAAMYPKPFDYEELKYYVKNIRELDRNINFDQQISTDILGGNVIANFHGTTEKVLVIKSSYYQCLHILDKNTDTLDPSLSKLENTAARYSNLDLIIDSPDSRPQMEWFGKPETKWCMYYEKADLARQRGDWQQVANLWEDAKSNGFRPKDEVEKLIFIEANARIGQWDKALLLSENFNDPIEGKMLCHLWNRINEVTTPNQEKQKSIQSLLDQQLCTSEEINKIQAIK